jgi:lipid II:glycine glycyltransferase (peptidoglycan interpeptide bridge formation enzyme)
MSPLAVTRAEWLEPASASGEAWEALAMRTPASGFMQSLWWAEFKRRRGLRTLHLLLHDDDHLIGGMLCYAPPPRHALGLLTAPDGPILPWEDRAMAREGLCLLLAAAERQAPEWGAQALQIEPRLLAPRPPLLRNFRRAAVDLLPTETLYLHLSGEPEAILAQMHPKGRYNIRLAVRRCVRVRESFDPASVHDFYPLLAAAGERDDFFVEPASFFATLADALCPAGMARFLFAEHDGELLATMLLVTYGERATYLYGAVANAGRQVMAGYALQWAAIRCAQSAGCSTYDFYGFEPTGDPRHLYANFSRFKRQFGGTPAQFIGAQTYTFNASLADAVIRAAREIYAP